MLSCSVQEMPQHKCCSRALVATLGAVVARLGGGLLRKGARGAALGEALDKEVQPAQGRETETLKHAAITA